MGVSQGKVAVDQEEEGLTIRVVYDGPPEVGKTTSVRALARSFGRAVYTPEERDGRTVFFDWLEHSGGRFEGAPIRCQIVSVPGQECWQERRNYFLERADAVVFVGDTSSAAFAETMRCLWKLRAQLDARSGVPVGIVFQANRRDALDAVPMSLVREQVASDRIAVVESVAIDGSGVRETFVLAVRLALDRVRDARDQGDVPSSEAWASTDELLELFRASAREADVGPPPSSVRTAPLAVTGPNTAPSRGPFDDLPSGLVWPPVEGRIILREATRQGAFELATERGDLMLDLGRGWCAHSYVGAQYDNLDAGRAALVDWARLHANSQTILSMRRCIALAEAGEGRYRLWQILMRENSLREIFVDGADGGDSPATERLLGIASRLLAEAMSLCETLTITLPCSFDTVGVSEADRPIYVGLMPPLASSRGHLLLDAEGLGDRRWAPGLRVNLPSEI